MIVNPVSHEMIILDRSFTNHPNLKTISD